MRSPVSTGQTALYVYGDMRVTGDINLDDITLDDASIQNLTITDTLHVTGLTTFVGFTTFNDYVFIQDGLNVSGAGITAPDINISGVATVGTLNAGHVGVITASSIDVAGLTTTKDLLVTGVTTSTDKEIYNQFDISNSGSGAYQFAATGIGFTQATNNPTLYLDKR